MASNWDAIAIVGVGLIGGSIGLAARQRRVAARVIGIGRHSQRLQPAMDRGAIDEFTTDVEQGVSRADLIVICAPVETVPGLVQRVAAACPPSAIITDAGSTKHRMVQQIEAEAVPGQAAFIGSHPLAGSEKTGVAYAQSDLFEDRLAIVTPTDLSATPNVDRVVEFWQQLGAQVRTMSPQAHDDVLAMTSHLPHVVASALAATTPQDCLPFTATGWLDTTRIAAGDVELWRQILAQNRSSVLRGLSEFGKVLDSFEQALRQADDSAIGNLLAKGKQRRDALAD